LLTEIFGDSFSFFSSIVSRRACLQQAGMMLVIKMWALHRSLPEAMLELSGFLF
jgi:hypothetical protein